MKRTSHADQYFNPSACPASSNLPDSYKQIPGFPRRLKNCVCPNYTRAKYERTSLFEALVRNNLSWNIRDLVHLLRAFY